MPARDAHTIPALVFAAADRDPDRRAIATMEDSVTYAQLRDVVTNFARHMRQRGIGRSARVALAGEHPIIMNALALACALVGCSWVRASAHALGHAVLRITHVVHAGPFTAVPRIPSIAVDPSWTRPPQGRDAAQGPFPGYQFPRDSWMIAASSGTTGASKYMALSEDMIGHRARETFLLGPAEKPVFLSLFPVLSYLGTMSILRTLAAGGTFVIGDLAELHGRVHLDAVLGSPNHMIEFMDRTAPGGTRIERAIVAGAVAAGPFYARVLNYFNSIMNMYGSTETSVLCTKILTADEIAADRLAAGMPAPDAEVQVVAEDGAPLPHGTEGIVRARSVSMVSGYIGEPGLSANVFREGWFHSGDLGTFSAEGELSVTGRVGDLVNVGGAKINPDRVDNILRALPGVKDAACFGQADADGIERLDAAVCLAGPGDPRALVPALRDAILDAVGPAGVPRRLYVLAAVPRNANGKLMRHALPEAVRGEPGHLVPAP